MTNKYCDYVLSYQPYTAALYFALANLPLHLSFISEPPRTITPPSLSRQLINPSGALPRSRSRALRLDTTLEKHTPSTSHQKSAQDGARQVEKGRRPRQHADERPLRPGQGQREEKDHSRYPYSKGHGRAVCHQRPARGLVCQDALRHRAGRTGRVPRDGRARRDRLHSREDEQRQDHPHRPEESLPPLGVRGKGGVGEAAREQGQAYGAEEAAMGLQHNGRGAGPGRARELLAVAQGTGRDARVPGSPDDSL